MTKSNFGRVYLLYERLSYRQTNPRRFTIVQRGAGSVFGCFNQTVTYGGEDALRSLFRKPLADRSQLQARMATIRFLMDNLEKLTLDKTTIDFVDYYLKRPDRPISFSASLPI
ncbi:MutS domain III [Parapedobacter luteus]|uniref:MutS domain III n=1 Tax=Parapedobacter luteus TaxID=623280 RepID=A0A1T5FB46_9SPHI|nr:MutS domain III [Parapedobacter luteus]